MNERKDSLPELDTQIEREDINSWDWAHAERYCRKYLERALYEIDKTYADDARAYTTAIIVTYSRPFSGNRTRHKKRDDINSIYLEKLNPQARALHNHIVEQRNVAFAHSDAAQHDVQISETDGGGLTTLSHDPLMPLEMTEVVGLLSNLQVFKAINEKLHMDAVAARSARKSAK